MYNNRPVIGVMPLYDTERDSYWMLPGYMKGLEKEGAITMMLPLIRDVEDLNYFISECDGFLFTGGQDVDPSIYNEKRSQYCGESVIIKDLMEKYILEQCIEKDIPVLGICRGIQLMNAALGGSLYQDIKSEYDTSVNHSMKPPYNNVQHTVTVAGPLKSLLKQDVIQVNSYHHQAIKELSPKLEVMAVSEDNLIEGVYMKGKKFIWGIQWHPELSYITSEESGKILRAFVKSAKIK